MAEIKAIPTKYKGIEFRSKLEAQWAVFFDACEIEWEYELEGYILSNGLRYQPDFLLHDVRIVHARDCFLPDLWVEVKGVLRENDARKITRFSGLNDSDYRGGVLPRPIVMVGSIPTDPWYDAILDKHENSVYGDAQFFDFGLIDCDFNYAAIPVALDGHLGLFGVNYFSGDDDTTACAFDIARNVRFDHGQTPPTKSELWALMREKKAAIKAKREQERLKQQREAEERAARKLKQSDSFLQRMLREAREREAKQKAEK